MSVAIAHNTNPVNTQTASRRWFLARAFGALAVAPIAASVRANSPSLELAQLGDRLAATFADYKSANRALHQWRGNFAAFKSTDPMPEPFYADHISTVTEANLEAFNAECRAWSQRVWSAIGRGDEVEARQREAAARLDECVGVFGAFEAAGLPDVFFKARFAEMQPRDGDEIEASIIADLLRLHGAKGGDA